MPKAIKFLDPNTGLIVAKDCVSGADLTAAQIAAAVPCPTTSVETADVCVQTVGNTDPTLIEQGAKEVSTFEISYNTDNTVNETILVSTTLYSADGTDITATHEKTACPVGLLPVGEICYA
jgi:hypothetical protein